MRQAQRQRRSVRVQLPLALIASVCATAYFAQHMVSGRHGLEARARLVDRATAVRGEVAALEREHARLSRDVRNLATDLADPDVVEEIARDVLGFGRRGDLVLSRATAR
jgi:cell division protein FtsB